MSRNKLNLLYIIVFALPIFSQNNSDQKPCSYQESKQFDFWIGSWDATWKNAEGSEAHGNNTITKTLDGCVIEENFNGSPGNELIGKSFSVYNPTTKKWQQTWVDNFGSYMVFTGEFSNNKMTLEREIVNAEGKKIKQRMIFYNIEKESFDWNWEKSLDGGKTWELSWKIHYSRK